MINMHVQISWLLKKPTDLELHCLQWQDLSAVRPLLIFPFKVKKWKFTSFKQAPVFKHPLFAFPIDAGLKQTVFVYSQRVFLDK